MFNNTVFGLRDNSLLKAEDFPGNKYKYTSAQ